VQEKTQGKASMIQSPVFRGILQAIDKAEIIALDALRSGDTDSEPEFTGRFIGAIDGQLANGIDMGDVTVRTRILRPQGSLSPERLVGADLITAIHAQFPGFSLSKGFLAQSKFLRDNEIRIQIHRNAHRPALQIRNSRRNLDDPGSLLNQCTRMLEYTPSSFVFGYHNSGVYVVSAQAIAKTDPDGEWRRVYWKSLHWFFNDFLQCFIGDEAVSARDDLSLNRARMARLVQNALLFQIVGNE
jgi:hypothetical protein